MKLSLLLISLTCTTIFAQLTAGDILFVGWYGDNGDGISFVTMNTIPDGTEIYFNDNEWNGSAVGSGGAFSSLTEGGIMWTNDEGGDIPAGVVVTIEGIDTVGNERSTCGSISLPAGSGNGCLRVNASNEVIYAYVGNSLSDPTTFLSAIANDGFSAGNGTLAGTGLTDGTNAINIGSLDADCDVGVYVPGNYSQASIMNTSNWAVQDGSFDQGQDGIYPDFPDDLPSGTAPCGIVVTLPVELIEFKVEYYNGSAQLSWATLSEINNDKFEILRSSDGFEYEKIGEMSGKGNSAIRNDYEYYDYKPLNGVSYYKLKQMDFDGQYEYSETKSFENHGVKDIEISIFPNPVLTDFFEIKSNQIQSVGTIEVFDTKGSLVPINCIKNESKIIVSGIHTSGIYLVRIETPNNYLVKKLVK